MPNGRKRARAAIVISHPRDRKKGSFLLTLGEQAVHHASDELELVLQAEVDKVCVDEDAVGRDEGVVVLQEQRGGDLRAVRSRKGRDRQGKRARVRTLA